MAIVGLSFGEREKQKARLGVESGLARNSGFFQPWRVIFAQTIVAKPTRASVRVYPPS